jgi:hypothetical protein
LWRDEDTAGDAAQRAKSGIVFDCVSHESSLHAIADFPLEIVPMMPILEWTYALFVFEICLPCEGGDACLRAYAKG